MKYYTELLFKVLNLNPDSMWIQFLLTSTLVCSALSLFTKAVFVRLRDFSDTCAHIENNLKNISNKVMFSVVGAFIGIIFFILICLFWYISVFSK